METQEEEMNPKLEIIIFIIQQELAWSKVFTFPHPGNDLRRQTPQKYMNMRKINCICTIAMKCFLPSSWAITQMDPIGSGRMVKPVCKQRRCLHVARKPSRCWVMLAKKDDWKDVRMIYKFNGILSFSSASGASSSPSSSSSSSSSQFVARRLKGSTLKRWSEEDHLSHP